MTEMIDKSLVRERFRQSLDTYDESAVVQAKMAQKLSELIEVHRSPIVGRALEIGAGSGMLSKHLPHAQIEQMWVNDLVDESMPVIEQIRPGFSPLSGDIEQLELPEDLDLILSGSTFQWLSDPKAFFHKLHDHLVPRGLLCFSTFGPDNCREVRELSGQGLPYMTLEEHLELLADFDCLHAEQIHYPMYFDNARKVLGHLKRTGVNGLQKRPWSITKVIKFQRQYDQQFRDEKGVRLTYHGMFFVLKKRS